MFKDEEKLDLAENILSLWAYFLRERGYNRLTDQENVPTFADFMTWLDNEFDRANKTPESKEKI